MSQTNAHALKMVKDSDVVTIRG